MKTERTDRLKKSLATITLILVTILLDLNAPISNAAQRPRRSAPSGGKSRAVELVGIDQLKGVFQGDADKVRLVALVSPT
jgi:hypothetical protein